MISDEKRREVAANLRDEAEAWRTDNGDDTVYSMSDDTFTESVLTAFGFDDMEMDAYRIFEKMADLIDRQTCENIADTHDGSNFECSECGERWELTCGSPADNHLNYCPRCGSEVVS